MNRYQRGGGLLSRIFYTGLFFGTNGPLEPVLKALFPLVGKNNWAWKRLPPPPYVNNLAYDCTAIQSYTLLNGGSTICISSSGRSPIGTYCFDTASREWKKAGRWALPFEGRAEHAPELGNLWFGGRGFSTALWTSGAYPSRRTIGDWCYSVPGAHSLSRRNGGNCPSDFLSTFL
jgi:hypothetical protein